MTYDTHVCLVSAQAIPNLTPALDPNSKPRRVVLIVSDHMQKEASWLTNVLKKHNIIVDQIEIGDAYDLAGIQNKMIDWIVANTNTNKDKSVALNVTGGTKIMAIAAQEAFRVADLPVFYVNVDTDSLLTIGNDSAPSKLSPKINLGDYLASHGFQLIKRQKPETPKELVVLTNSLIENVDRFAPALGRLNQLAQDAKPAKQNLLSSPMRSGDQDIRSLNDLINLFEQAGLLSREGEQLRFESEEDRFFVNGGWLEFHIYRCLATIAGELKIKDYSISVEVTHPDGKTRNEIDAAFLHANRLYIIECKAANLKRSGDSGDTKLTEAVYKLENLTKIGGLRTYGMLIDYRGMLSDADKARAAQQRIKLLSGKQLQHLKGEIKSWVNAAR